MKIKKQIISCTLFFLLFVCSSLIPQNKTIFEKIEGFNPDINNKIEKFLLATENFNGRKIAVFDGDGTVLGQVPHYLADECLYSYASQHPERKPGLIETMKKQSNVSLEYVQNRVKYMSGDSLNVWRNAGYEHFKKYYSGKMYPPMKDLISLLQKNNFEVWVVSASPEAMYQKFLSEELEIPVTNIIGVKSVIRNGIITDEIIQPVPQDHGKKEAIESFIQDRPLFAAGNSRGDKEMIEYASLIHMIINPDEHKAPDQEESIAQYAERNNWLVAKINDTTVNNFPSISSEKFGIKTNKTNAVK